MFYDEEYVEFSGEGLITRPASLAEVFIISIRSSLFLFIFKIRALVEFKYRAFHALNIPSWYWIQSSC